VRRWIFIILLFLLLVSGSAIVNVAVAWGCAVLITLPPPTLTRPSVGAPDATPQDATEPLDDRWLARSGWNRTAPDELYVYRIEIESSSVFGLTRREFLERCCVNPDNPRDVIIMDRWRYPFARQVRAGWPMKALLGGHLINARRRQGIVSSRTERWRTVDAIDISLINPKKDDWAGRDLPLRPMCPGFAINTLFYAIILWLLIPGPFVLRRLIRIKRGRCPRCGYDLRHALSGGCPECGWKREGTS